MYIVFDIANFSHLVATISGQICFINPHYVTDDMRQHNNTTTDPPA